MDVHEFHESLLIQCLNARSKYSLPKNGVCLKWYRTARIWPETEGAAYHTTGPHMSNSHPANALGVLLLLTKSCFSSHCFWVLSIVQWRSVPFFFPHTLSELLPFWYCKLHIILANGHRKGSVHISIWECLRRNVERLKRVDNSFH